MRFGVKNKIIRELYAQQWMQEREKILFYIYGLYGLIILIFPYILLNAILELFHYAL